MSHSLSALVPNVADLLTLEVEELAGVLLVHLKDYEHTADKQGGINYNNFFNAPHATITKADRMK